jgi:hypothetical protein
MSRCNDCEKRGRHGRNGRDGRDGERFGREGFGGGGGCGFGCPRQRLLCLRSHEFVTSRCECIKRRTVIACNPCAIPCTGGCCNNW